MGLIPIPAFMLIIILAAVLIFGAAILVFLGLLHAHRKSEPTEREEAQKAEVRDLKKEEKDIEGEPKSS